MGIKEPRIAPGCEYREFGDGTRYYRVPGSEKWLSLQEYVLWHQETYGHLEDGASAVDYLNELNKLR